MRRLTGIWCSLLVAGLLSGASIAETGGARFNTSPYIVTADVLAARVHTLINVERKKSGLSTLRWNPTLAIVATGHSRDMAERGYFAHESPERRDFAHRYQKARFDCAVRSGKHIWTGAENIALARLYNSSHRVNNVVTYDWNSPEAIARMTVEGWMRSPGHRENILTAHWRQQGIGVVIAPENRILITQNFC